MFTIGKALGLLILFLSFNGINSLYQKPQLVISKQDLAFNFSDQIYKFMNMGNNRLLSSLLWVKTLMDSDIEHYKKKDLNSWLYLRFDQIIKLEPKFLPVYRFGGQYLSIIKDDDQGALEIYMKGLKKYPEDYFLNYNTAFHYLFELNSPRKALPLYNKIKYHPHAPGYLPSLIARLTLGEKSSLQDAYDILLDAYQKTAKDSPMKKYFSNKLYAIKAEIDLKCLNQDNNNCQRYDFDGNPYIKNSSKYQAPKAWLPFQAHEIKK